MPTFFTVSRSNVAQAADNIEWLAGDNVIVFPEPFADTNYVLDVHCGDAGVTVKEKSRTTTSVTVTVTGGSTTSGYYYAVGTSSDYRVSGIDAEEETGYRQRGSGTLVAGNNTINFSVAFANTNYQFIPNFNEGSGYVVDGSKTTTSVVVYSVGDNNNFDWVAHGQKGS